MERLSRRQAQALKIIRDLTESRGIPPTRAEIARKLRVSSINAASELIKALARKGALKLVPHSTRGIKIAGGIGLPLVGRVPAGSPILAEKHILARYRIDPALFKPRADFLVKVHGKEMESMGFLDGDFLAVHKISKARSGDIVIARLNGEISVGRLRRRRSKIELLSEYRGVVSVNVDPDKDRFAIEGVVVGTIRRKS